MSASTAPQKQEPESARRLFDIFAAVAYLQSLGATSATRNFVRSLVTSGQVPYIRCGKKFYITKNALDAWITRSERRAR
jgi:excisionase family DNA binding protein